MDSSAAASVSSGSRKFSPSTTCTHAGHGRSGGSIRSDFKRLPMDSSQNTKETITNIINLETDMGQNGSSVKVNIYLTRSDDLGFAHSPMALTIPIAWVAYSSVKIYIYPMRSDELGFAHSAMARVIPVAWIACVYNLYMTMGCLATAIVIGSVAAPLAMVCVWKLVHLIGWDTEQFAPLCCLFLLSTFLD